MLKTKTPEDALRIVKATEAVSEEREMLLSPREQRYERGEWWEEAKGNLGRILSWNRAGVGGTVRKRAVTPLPLCSYRKIVSLSNKSRQGPGRNVPGIGRVMNHSTSQRRFWAWIL